MKKILSLIFALSIILSSVSSITNPFSPPVPVPVITTEAVPALMLFLYDITY